MSLQIAGKTVLVTGANRGLGRALVDESLARGAARVYAASRQTMLAADERVSLLTMDITNPGQIEEAAARVEALDILINNAGVSVPNDLSDRASFENHLAVNLFWTLSVTDAFLPLLFRSRGSVVNVVSLSAVAAVPIMPAYSVSKAAALSVTQCLRALMANRGVSFHAVLPGPIDTEMVRDLDLPKSPPDAVARGIFDGLERREEEIFPDPMSEMLAEAWRSGVTKEFERQNALMNQIKPQVA